MYGQLSHSRNLRVSPVHSKSFLGKFTNVVSNATALTKLGLGFLARFFLPFCSQELVNYLEMAESHYVQSKCIEIIVTYAVYDNQKKYLFSDPKVRASFKLVGEKFRQNLLHDVSGSIEQDSNA